MKDILEKLKQMVLQKEKMIVITLVGILVLVVCMPVKEKDDFKTKDTLTLTQGVSASETTDKQYKKEIERELELLLGNMDGVGQVQVMITLKSSGQKILAKDEPYSISTTTEEDAEGGKRSIEEKTSEGTTVFGKYASGEELPYIVKEIRPEVEGVFIVAEGGEEDKIRLQITEAVQALFDIEAHKIKIAKRKS